MSLARAWRRQLYGASSAALIVPSAMLTALLVLALGGGFGHVGVLGQIFAGPPAPGVAGGTAGTPAPSLPAIPETVRRGPARAGNGSAGTRSARRHVGVAPVSIPVASHGPSQTGGAVGGAAPVVGGGSQAPVPSHPAPTQSSPPPGPSPQPQPQPQPRPTPVDQIVNAVTPVTQELPAPAGPAATQVVQAAGSAADGLKLP